MAYDIALPFLRNKHSATPVKSSSAAISSDGSVSAFMFKRLSGIAFNLSIATSQNTLFTESLNVLTATNPEVPFEVVGNGYVHPTGDGNLHVPATGTGANGFTLIAGATAGSMAWTALTKSMVGLANVDNTSDANKPVSTATQTALNLKSDTTHTHAVATTSVAGFMSATDKTKLDGVAPGANNYVHPTGDGNLHVPVTGTTNGGFALIAGSTAGSMAWTALTKSMVGLANVDNTSDANKPVSTATQTALNLKSDTTHTHAVATTSVSGFMSATDKTKLDGVAPGANNYVHPTGDGNLHVPVTGTTNDGFALIAGATAGSMAWTALTKSMVGLANVDNTSDVNKPISTATQTALNLKSDTTHTHAVATTSVSGFMSATDKTKLDGVAPGANNYVHPSGDGNLHVPVTGTTNNGRALIAGSTAGSMAWTALTKSMVGLANVDNTSDANKPVSTATQTALNLKSDTTHTHAVATTSVSGFMSAIDKTKLDSYPAGSTTVINTTSTINFDVPAIYPTIQAALDATLNYRFLGAAYGTVRVSPGTYSITAALVLAHPQPDRIRLWGTIAPPNVSAITYSENNATMLANIEAAWQTKVYCAANAITSFGHIYMDIRNIAFIFTGTSNVQGVNLGYGAQAYLDRCAFHNFQNGFYLSYVAGLIANNCILSGSRSTGLTLAAMSTANMTSSAVYNTTTYGVQVSNSSSFSANTVSFFNANGQCSRFVTASSLASAVFATCLFRKSISYGFYVLGQSNLSIATNCVIEDCNDTSTSYIILADNNSIVTLSGTLIKSCVARHALYATKNCSGIISNVTFETPIAPNTDYLVSALYNSMFDVSGTLTGPYSLSPALNVDGNFGSLFY